MATAKKAPCEESGSGQESRTCSEESGSREKGGSAGKKSSRQGTCQEGCGTRQEGTPPSKAAAKRTPNAAFMKAMTPSDALAAIIGKGPYPRTEVTKKIWDYIKKNKLQDEANKRMINADAKLKEIFKKAQASMFEMTKMISSAPQVKRAEGLAQAPVPAHEKSPV
jgi:upstream activation factor subunit UAF30